jgi:signal transduction histidine kinase/ActR/RegA family two-component response regulator
MVVPLLARGRTLGVISLVMAESGRRYTESDLVLAEDLARRCALAVDNARLYREAQEALHAREEALTREQEARREAEVANKVKDEFLATVSHELRTPLTAMLGWLRLLRSGKLNDRDTSRAIETIERNAKVQTQLIEDLLDVSRIITGKIHLDTRQVILSQVIQTAIDAVRPVAEAKEIELGTEAVFNDAAVWGDPARLQQVILNLLTNAVKFTPPGGRVEVCLERNGSHAQVMVKDTGKGIKPEFLPYVFDRFAQADSTTTRAYGGLGLGLAIVKHLTEMQGGTVSASSNGEGCGATFTIKLPLITSSSRTYMEDRVEETSVLIPSDNAPALDGLSVLVVEDEEDTREMLTMVLEQSGAKVRASASAAEALQAFQQSRPDILISDIAMPGQDGHALIKMLRELENEQGKQCIPAVALTAQARLEDRTQALAAGFNFHVPKPVEPTELVSLVATMAKRV